jgi:hypothetical protein
VLPLVVQAVPALMGAAPLLHFCPRFITHFLGGGWCWSIEDCANRATSLIGTSKNWPPFLSGITPNMSYGGIMSGNATENPDFATWALVWIMYCDGSSYTSNVADPVPYNGTVLYFRGRRLLDEIFTDLVQVCQLLLVSLL